jgi:hypothetical protein
MSKCIGAGLWPNLLFSSLSVFKILYLLFAEKISIPTRDAYLSLTGQADMIIVELASVKGRHAWLG